jgi:hypothetical protein
MNYGSIDRFITPVVGFIFFAVIAAFVIVSFILDYHWRNYTTDYSKLTRMRMTYVTVSGILILIMCVALIYLFPST